MLLPLKLLAIWKFAHHVLISFSSGGDVVVLYASIYKDVPMVVNLSGRFHLEKGIEERLGKEFMDRINKEGYIDAKDKSGMGTCLTYIERYATQTISSACDLFAFHVHLITAYLLRCRKGFVQSNQGELDGTAEP
jgi:hypothetical protein